MRCLFCGYFFIVTDLQFMDICMLSPYAYLFLFKLKGLPNSANASVVSHMESGKETCVLDLQNTKEGKMLRGEE